MGYPLIRDLFIEIDEIDHLTILHRKGKTFSAEKAAAVLLRHAALDADVAAALALAPAEYAPETLRALPQERLYGLLVAAREALLRKTGL